MDNRTKQILGYTVALGAIGGLMLATVFASQTERLDITVADVEKRADFSPHGGSISRTITDTSGNEYFCDDAFKAPADRYCHKFREGVTVTAEVAGVPTLGTQFIKGIVPR